MLSSEQQKAVRNVVKRASNKIDELLISHKLPENGFSEGLLIQLMENLADADSNNFDDAVGAGEREGRIACPLVGRLSFGLTHGIGRSGNVAEAQPKALGSSTLNSLANTIALEALKVLGLESCKKALVLPVCTGMALTLSLLTLKQLRSSGTHVIFSRIDQKSCLKSIFAAGLTPIVVDQKPITSSTDNTFCELGIDESDLEAAMEGVDKANILCILSTTSCFAPRKPDSMILNGKFSRQHGFFHLVNNAYGLQSKPIISQLEAALSSDLIDLFVQSTDKNFLTPVGGSIVASSRKEFVTKVGKLYPGRASSVPSRDFLLTVLHMGKIGLRKMVADRDEVYVLLKQRMKTLAKEFIEVIIEPEGNGISIAMSLTSIPKEECKKLGGILFSRYKVTGSRVIVSNGSATNVNGLNLIDFGSHCNIQLSPYITVAAGVGMTAEEVDEVVQRLRSVMLEMKTS